MGRSKRNSKQIDNYERKQEEALRVKKIAAKMGNWKEIS